MPGRNSNFNASKISLIDRIFCNGAYIWIGLIIFLVEVMGMYRYYFAWNDLAYSLECNILCLLWVIYDVHIFAGLYVTHHSDPGYIIPSQQLVTKGISETEPNCQKCGVVKVHFRIHHCSRCGRCVDYMDHHCAVTDNCVGKANVKYFFHFVLWAFTALFTGFMVVFRHIYTTNREKKIGMQYITDLLLVWNPTNAIKKFIYGEASWLILPDAIYSAILIGLMTMVLAPLISTTLNLRNQTDEVLKLKSYKKDDDHGLGDGRKLSLREIYDFIYGKDTPVLKAMCASFLL